MRISLRIRNALLSEERERESMYTRVYAYTCVYLLVLGMPYSLSAQRCSALIENTLIRGGVPVAL